MTDKKPKRILIFSLVYYPRFIGGAEVAIKEITDRLPKGEYEFDMVTLRKGDPSFEKIGNVNIYRIGSSKYLFTILGAWYAGRLHKKKKYDAVWSMMANYAGFAALFFKLRHPRTPFILSLQEGDPIDHIKRRVRYVYPLFKKIFAEADIIQTISNYLADFARDMGGKNIVVVPNGVDVLHFSAEIPESQMSDVHSEIGKKSGDIFLITTSRLVVKNAVSDIIRALRFLPEHVKLLVCGNGYEEADLRALAGTLSLGRVVFKGFVAQKDMPKYLKACDIFIRPSLSEGFGNSFIEAMAARVPVIATPVGGIVDFLTDKRTGLFCGISDAKDIALKVQIYIRDVDLREEIVDNAFLMVKEKYDWNLVARDMDGKVFKKKLS
jgi:glycosyltransferase involved in cell wall biosynthesis